MKPTEKQRINTDTLIAALKRRKLSLNSLAKVLGVSPSSLHRWVHTDKAIRRSFIFDIGMNLELDQEEIDSLLMVPKYQTFFRCGCNEY